ncbi:MAG: hypothetical protein KDD70_17970, partial [Bdellovibrionales bacterium]|nr:hypothetical protein [Bdellovibrionales bacterium]
NSAIWKSYLPSFQKQGKNLVLAEISDRLKHFLVGGAAPSERLKRMVEMVGLPAVDGYGLSELTPVSAKPLGSHLSSPRPQVFPGVDVTINKYNHNALTVKGKHQPIAYYDGRSALHFEGEEGTPTGDRALLHRNGKEQMLEILPGKLKFRFKLANGQYVHPEVLEEVALKPEITRGIFSEAVAVGDNQSRAGLLVSLNDERFHDYAARYGVRLAGKISEDEESIRQIVRPMYEAINGQLNNMLAVWRILVVDGPLKPVHDPRGQDGPLTREEKIGLRARYHYEIERAYESDRRTHLIYRLGEDYFPPELHWEPEDD